ncbi:hypothetical protein Tco_1469322 [Tanacetum coccineum]
MKITKTTGSMNGIKMYHGCTTSHGLIKKYGKSQHQSNIRASLSILRLDVRNSQPVVGEKMVIVIEEICPVPTILETRSITKTLNGGRWSVYTNYDDAYEINHEDNEREELCEVHELPVCNVRRYIMIKYSFNNNEEYVAVKEDEYNDLTITRKETCQAYREIFWIMDEGWMVTRAG